MTGFRYGLGGAQGRFGVCPDLTCVGKALANGYPLAALCGRQDLMALFEDGNVFMSATHAAHPVSLAAANATLETLRMTDALSTLARQGERLGNELQQLCMDLALPVTLLGNEARMVLRWHPDPQGRASMPEIRTLWQEQTLAHGVLFYGNGPTFTMTCLTEADVDEILAAATAACHVIREALDAGTVRETLQGPVLETDAFGARYPVAPR